LDLRKDRKTSRASKERARIAHTTYGKASRRRDEGGKEKPGERVKTRASALPPELARKGKGGKYDSEGKKEGKSQKGEVSGSKGRIEGGNQKTSTPCGETKENNRSEKVDALAGSCGKGRNAGSHGAEGGWGDGVELLRRYRLRRRERGGSSRSRGRKKKRSSPVSKLPSHK